VEVALTPAAANEFGFESRSGDLYGTTAG
jgi:hypothetical protein